MDLRSSDTERIHQVSVILVDPFRELSTAWVPTEEAALEEIAESFEAGRLSRVALVDGRVAGWVGARPSYGSVWELHPICVDAACRGQGIGRVLVEDVERCVASRGALTLQLGTSDEVGRTSLFQRDLYVDPLGALRDVKATADHPLGFWLRVGFTIVGVVPDAEGAGKPTINLAKRVAGSV